jgi:hypothetical protein
MKKNTEKDFWERVDKDTSPTGCWLWTGGKNHGYGRISFNGKNFLAPRIAWEFTNGPIPDGLDVLHRCDNPPCVRPDHLFLGTLKDNYDDMVQKGRKAQIDYRAAQLIGAEIKKQNTLNVTLPFVLLQIQKIIDSGKKPTLRICAKIPGYNTILGHYLTHNEILALVKGEETSKV